MTISSVEDVINLALREIGYPRPISDIYEGSRASRAALDIYSQTRDQVLRDHNWPFATRDAALVSNNQPPPQGWLAEYTYPSDAVRVRNLKPATILSPNFDPVPLLWAEWNDNRLSPAAKVILCNVSPVVAVYVGRITDPSTWEPGFTAALIEWLTQKLKRLIQTEKEITNTEPALEMMVAGVSSINPPNDAVQPWLQQSKNSAT